jgi:hypothetical protein
VQLDSAADIAVLSQLPAAKQLSSSSCAALVKLAARRGNMKCFNQLSSSVAANKLSQVQHIEALLLAYEGVRKPFTE